MHSFNLWLDSYTPWLTISWHRQRNNMYLSFPKLYQGKLEVHEVNKQIIFKGISTATSTSTSSSTTTSTSTATSSSTTWPPSPVRPSEADSQDFNESSDNSEDPQTAKEYLNADNPINDRNWWLLAFFKYLNLPDCARKKGMRTMLEQYLDPRGEDIAVLTEDEGYIVGTDFVDPRMDEIKGGTLRSYLILNEIFLSLVMIERVHKGIVPEVNSDSTTIFKNTIPRLKGW